MIVDCFLFCDEFDMLERRFAALYDHVDRFVLSQSTRTFQGEWKGALYVGRDPKVRTVCSFGDGLTDPWAREDEQREALARGLDGVPDDAIILLSDVDEIWNPEALKEPDPILVFQQEWFVWSERWRYPKPWEGTAACHKATLDELGPEPFKALRSCRLHAKPERVPNGGAHYTWFGGVEAAQRKLRSFSHVELAYLHDEIPRLIEEGVHVDGVKLIEVDQ